MTGAWRRGCVAVGLGMLLSGCGAADPGPASPDGGVEVLEVRGSDAFRLAPGESARLPGGTVVSFQGVESDSRCPIDAVCVWEGNAVVLVRLQVGVAPERYARLGTSQDPRFVDVQGGRLHLDLLEPALSASQPVDPTRYRATFRFAPVVPGG